MTERTYRIGEAARLLDLEGYVLRFWETEFSQLQPRRTPKGQRVYSETDLALLRRIRELLHEQGMTIEGARRVLAGQVHPALSPAASSPAALSPAAPSPAVQQVQGFLPSFPLRSGPEHGPEHGPDYGPGHGPDHGPDQDCLALLAQVERELLSLQRLLRQPG